MALNPVPQMSRDMRFPTMWYVWSAKPQISLRIPAVWSEPLLVTWIFYDCSATDWTSFSVSKLKRRLYRLAWVYICQNATLLEITCRGSYGLQGEQWLSVRMLYSIPRGCRFEPHPRHYVVSLGKTHFPCLVLVQPRKTRPDITEKLLTGT